MPEITVEVPIKVRYGRTPYTLARTSGPPENCYPEDGGELEWEFADDIELLYSDIEKAIMEHEKQ